MDAADKRADEPQHADEERTQVEQDAKNLGEADLDAIAGGVRIKLSGKRERIKSDDK